MTQRRVGPDVCKIQVECDQYSIFGAARSENCGIWSPGEPFGQRILDVVAKITQGGSDPSRKVFVEFESKGHAAVLRGHWNDSLTIRFSGVANRSWDVLWLESWVLIQNGLRGFARG